MYVFPTSTLHIVSLPAAVHACTCMYRCMGAGIDRSIAKLQLIAPIFTTLKVASFRILPHILYLPEQRVFVLVRTSTPIFNKALYKCYTHTLYMYIPMVSTLQEVLTSSVPIPSIQSHGCILCLLNIIVSTYRLKNTMQRKNSQTDSDVYQVSWKHEYACN